MALQLPQSSAATFGTSIQPLGTVKSSAYGGSYSQIGAFQTASLTTGTGRIKGKAIVGKVTDGQGRPLEGVAVQVGKEIAYSDDQGIFEIRTNGRKELPITIRNDLFTTLGEWSCTAPEKASPWIDVAVICNRK